MKPILLLLLLSACLAQARAGDLYVRDFGGAYDPDGLQIWTGPTVDAWGKIAPGPLPESLRAAGPAQAMIFRSANAAPKGFASSLKVMVPAGADPAKVRRFHLRFLVPVAGDYRVDIHFAGNWDSNAAIVVLQNGVIGAWNPAKGIDVGHYDIDKWDDLVVAFDPGKKTYSIVLNGAPAANDLPWNDPKIAAVGDVQIVGDIERTATDDAPALYLAALGISEE